MRADILIITAADGEDAAVRAVTLGSISGWRELNDREKPRGFLFPLWCSTFSRDKGKPPIHVVIARTPDQREHATAGIAAPLISFFDPFCLAMCGVCAGRPGAVNLGDVIIADKVWKYDQGAIVASAKGGDADFEPEIETYQLPKHWKLEAEGFSCRLPDGADWLAERPTPDDKRKWSIHVGGIGTGSNLVRDASIWDRLRRTQNRKIVGLEMEASAIGWLAEAFDVRRKIVVKGVMDHGDVTKSNKCRRFAAHAAAEVLIQFLRTHLDDNERLGHFGRRKWKSDYDAVLFDAEGDDSDAEAIVESLRQKRGLAVLRQRLSLPFDSGRSDVERLLDQTAVCIVIIGKHGADIWENPKLHALIQSQVEFRDLRVIVVRRASRAETYRPGVLNERQLIDLRAQDTVDERLIGALTEEITGQRVAGVNADDTERRSGKRSLGTVIVDSVVAVSDFQNRPELEILRSFWTHQDIGVLGLVGIGGSGKTALVSRFLQELPGSGIDAPTVPKNESNPKANGLFFWSFYDQPDVEIFFKEIYRYLGGISRPSGSARDTVFRVIRAIEQSASERILIVLDGLEVIQEGRQDEQAFGVFRDSSIRHLVRRIAYSRLGFKMVLTSRFPFPDLTGFESSRYRWIETDHLEQESARALLRSRGTRGSDAQLDELIRAFGKHALSLDHLGTLLRDFFDGDPRRAAELPPMGSVKSADDADYQARRLSRIFAFYSRRIPALELRVLQVLSVYRTPVLASRVVSVLRAVKISESRRRPVAEVETRSILKRLHSRRLINIAGTGDAATCLVHPSIRDYFYRMIGRERTNIHATVRDDLMSLIERPLQTRAPVDEATLGVIEEFIFHAVESGDTREANRLYRRIGGYEHLSWHQAQYQRGLRITSLLAESGRRDLLGSHRDNPWHHWCLFLMDNGEPHTAETHLHELERDEEAISKRSTSKQNDARSIALPFDMRRAVASWNVQTLRECICDTFLAQGKLEEAEVCATKVVDFYAAHSGEANLIDQMRMHYYGANQVISSNPVSRRGIARFLLGRVKDALSDFEKSDFFPIKADENRTLLVNSPAGAFGVVLRGSYLLRLGRMRDARECLRRLENLRGQVPPRVVAHCNLVRAEMLRMNREHSKALMLADSALAWAVQSGHRETYILAITMKGRLVLALESPLAALNILKEAHSVAMASGYLVHAVDAIVSEGYALLAADNFKGAVANSVKAFDISSDRNCGYLWGMGNACHLRAKALDGNTSHSDWRDWAQRAMDIRQQLGDPRGIHTEALLARAKNGG